MYQKCFKQKDYESNNFFSKIALCVILCASAVFADEEKVQEKRGVLGTSLGYGGLGYNGIGGLGGILPLWSAIACNFEYSNGSKLWLSVMKAC